MENVDNRSGFGFELTFRLVKGQEQQAPIWPYNMMQVCPPTAATPPWQLCALVWGWHALTLLCSQNVARYVFKSGICFGEGDKINVNGPITVDQQTEVSCHTPPLRPAPAVAAARTAVSSCLAPPPPPCHLLAAAQAALFLLGRLC